MESSETPNEIQYRKKSRSTFDINSPFTPLSPLTSSSPPPPLHTNAGTQILALINPQMPSSSGSSFSGGGTRLSGDRFCYDVDAPERTTHQLQFNPVTKYGSDPELVVGRRIAVNWSYICYGLKDGNVRVLNNSTCTRALLRGHAKRVTDMVFLANDVQLLASVSVEGRVLAWKIYEDEEEGIIGDAVVAIQFHGDGERDYLHPRLCWHCHKQVIK